MKEISTTNQFKKDLKLSKKRGKEMKKIFSIIEALRQDKKLHQKHKEHKLTGNYKQYLECHIEPDWLLIYKISPRLIILYRTGSHSDLF